MHVTKVTIKSKLMNDIDNRVAFNRQISYFYNSFKTVKLKFDDWNIGTMKLGNNLKAFAISFFKHYNIIGYLFVFTFEWLRYITNNIPPQFFAIKKTKYFLSPNNIIYIIKNEIDGIEMFIFFMRINHQ